jgi:hypothetical protein
MATWDFQIDAASSQGEGASGSNSITSGRPGDFDNATINSVQVLSAPSITLNSWTDDLVGVRFWVEASGGADTYGGNGSDAASMCWADESNTTIDEGSSPSPAPGTAVAADWDTAAWAINYVAEKMSDGATVDWSNFSVRVDYTPPPPDVLMAQVQM